MIRILVANLTQWDQQVCLRIFKWNGVRLLDGLMLAFSRLGDGYFYAIIGILVAWIDRANASMFWKTGLLAFAFELILYKLLKTKIKRIRPFHVITEIKYLIKPPDGFSFPSGHTAAAFVMATLLSAFYSDLSLYAYISASLIGLSRVYNGVHYPTDVIAGSFLGTICALSSLFISM
jgi:undecaprenyl-diphosphatase